MAPRTVRRTVGRVVAFLGMLLMLVAGVSFGPAPPTAQAAPAQVSTTRAAALAGPAVVRIVSEVDGVVACVACANDGSNITFPLTSSSPFAIGVTGSGAFVSPDGYVLTANHVADPVNNPTIRAFFLSLAAADLAKTGDYSSSYAQSVIQQLDSAGRLHVEMKLASQRAFLSTAYTGQLQNTAQVTSFAVTRIVTGSPVDKQDTAIVKVEAHDMPFLLLAPASSIKVQEAVTAVSYPSDADTGDFTYLFAPTQSDVNTINGLLSPSVETGQVTAQKTLPDGTLVYQTNGIATFGSSGGPVIDVQGRIVGFADAVSASGGRVVYLIPSDVVAEYVKEAGITNPSGAFMTAWTKAMDDFYATSAGHWGKAVTDLKAVRANYTAFGGVTSYLDEAQTKAAAEPKATTTTSGGFPWMFVIGGAVLLALLVAGGVGGYKYMVRRREKAPVAAPEAATAVPMQPLGTQQVMAQPPVMATPISSPPISQPLTVQTPISQPISPMPAPIASWQAPAEQHVCPNGHVVPDPAAHFCPECGAELKIPAHA